MRRLIVLTIILLLPVFCYSQALRGDGLRVKKNIKAHDGDFSGDVEIDGKLVVDDSLRVNGTMLVKGDATFEARMYIISTANDSLFIIGETPVLVVHNTTEEDGDYGREGKLIFWGEQSGGEKTALGEIEFAHDGSSDDKKGILTIKVHDGSSLSDMVTVDAAGQMGLGMLNISQQFQISKNFRLPITLTGSDSGIIYKGADRFIHDFKATGSEGYNTFIGVNAGNFTMAIDGQTYHASSNTGIGYNTLQALTTGYYNTASGQAALYSNTTGHSNTACGQAALYSNTTGHSNTVTGRDALYSNTSGYSNTASGKGALYYNESNNNTALGYASFNTFNEDAGDTETFAFGDVDAAGDTITIVSHDWTGYVNLKYTEGTSAITGLTDGDIDLYEVVDVDNLVGLTTAITAAGSGTGHTFTHQEVYTNSSALGNDAEPDASNQIVLGDANVTQVKSAGDHLPSTDEGANVGSASLKYNLIYADSIHASNYGGLSDFTIGSSGADATISADSLKVNSAFVVIVANEDIATFRGTLEYWAGISVGSEVGDTGDPYYAYFKAGVKRGYTYMDANDFFVYVGGDRLTITSLGDGSIGGISPTTRWEIVDNNANTAHPLLTLLNDDEQATGETGQTIDVIFELKGTVDSGSNYTDEEAAKISIVKVGDYWHASDQTDNDSKMEFYTVTDGSYVKAATLQDDDLTIVGDIIVTNLYGDSLNFDTNKLVFSPVQDSLYVVDLKVDGTATLDAVASGGTITAEHLVSTDDADINDNLTVGDIIVDEASGVISHTGATLFTLTSVADIEITTTSNNEDIKLIPNGSGDIILDGHWNFNANALTSLTDNNTTLTAYAGKNVTVESVTFDGGAVGGVTTLSMNNQLTNTLAIGTSPFVITSTTVNTNLNADLLDGESAAAFEDADADLTALAALAGTGLVARTGAATYSEREITGTIGQITVINGNGVSGNPTLSLPDTLNIDTSKLVYSPVQDSLYLTDLKVDGVATLDDATLGGAYIYRAGGTDVPDEDVANNISLTNITQIGTRPVTSLTATNWRMFYSADGAVPVELALGADGTYLQSSGASSLPEFTAPLMTDFNGEANWKVWYSNGSGDLIELALGADGTFFQSSGAATLPEFTALVAGDIPDISGTTGAIGTGLVSIAGQTETNGGMLYGTADNAYAWLAAGAEGTLLMGNGAGAPSFLAAGTAGYFLIANGAADPVWTTQPTLVSIEGLTIAAGTLIYGTGADAVAALAAGATTEILVGGGAAAPVWTTATGTGAPVRAASPALTGTATAVNITLSGELVETPGGDDTISDAGTIDVTGHAYLRVVSDDADATNVNIEDGTADGQRLLLQGTADGNLVTITDGNNCQLAGGVNFSLGIGDTIELVWDSGESTWWEISRSDN